ncbi:MAG: PSD1 and planctomycete cytochrome C domain-containing protein [Planctomycetota bacterium]
MLVEPRLLFPKLGLPLVRLLALFLAFELLNGPQPAAGQESFSAADVEFFEAKIRPILVERCYECHGEGEGSGGLHLTSRADILEGGDTGPALDLKQVDQSLMLQAIRWEGGYEMPPDSKLPAAEIELIAEWVKRGAPWPADSANAKRKSEDKIDVAQRKSEHWCWQGIAQVHPPQVTDSAWVRDPIDAFVLAKIEAAGVRPAEDAERSLLLRRVHFDLIGLPPSAEEIQAFLADSSPEALERVVDRLLASPQFGERWARHWMDLTRYAETYGHEFDYPIPEAFRYRDYLIRAFNADVPYDQFIKEQIAGDLLPEPRLHPTERYNEALIGTGFWYFGEETHSPVDVKGDEAGHIDNQIDVLSKTFLGLTVSCARCHEHKFDAITTEDYYALSGFLQSSRHQKGMLDPGGKIAEKLALSREQERTVAAALREWQQSAYVQGLSRPEPWLEVIRFLREHPRPPQPAETLVQGEAMRVTSPSVGEVKPEHLPARDGLSWSGDHQLLWTGGTPGGELELKFDLSVAGDYQIVGFLTEGPEYARAQLTLDDQPLGEEVDCLEASGHRPQPLVRGLRSLGAGEHQLKVRLAEAAPGQAAPLRFGLDCLRLVKADEQATQEAWFQKLNQKSNVMGQPLEFLNGIELVNQARDWAHPAFFLRRLSELGERSEAEALQTVRAELKSVTATWREKRQKSVTLADFAAGFSGWFVTGVGLTEAWRERNSLAPDGSLLPGGIVSSRRWGDGFQGVLRSPTFRVEHGQIHFRYRGKGGQARVIVDGYDMDIYNGLLFEGMTIGLPEMSEFGWVTIAGSLRNYIGHTAHLEFIDQGAGYFELGEVCCSDGEGVPNSIDPANHVALAGEATDVATVAAQFGRHCAEQLDWPSEPSPLLLGATLKQPGYESRGDKERAQGLEAALTAWREQVRDIPAPLYCLAMTEGTPEDEHVFIRGNHKSLGAVVPRRNLEALGFASAAEYAAAGGSGRLKLAEEIASAENPLTSRVIVNRLWHHLFGRGIVESVDNFGVLGTLPTHPELLDYLAREFTADSWSLKRMIKRMVLSHTYQLASTADAKSQAADPANQLFHVHNLRRLEGEALRDAMLAVSGDLDLTMYGPSIPVHLTPFMQGRGRPGSSGPVDGNRRRSVYLEVRRNFLNPMMLAFDTPAPFSAIGRRNVSNVPAQALILMNDPFVLEQAERWARRLLEIEEDAESRIGRMFFRAIGRGPTEEELARCLRFVAQDVRQIAGKSGDELEAWRDLAHVLFNLMEFVFLY